VAISWPFRGHFVRTLLQDAAYSHRFLASRPGFTLAAALTLALGIGANTAVFSVLRSVLIRPLPIARPDRVVLVHEIDADRGVSYNSCSQRLFLAARDRADVFQSMSAYYGRIANFQGGGQLVTVNAAQTDAAFFDVTGFVPAVGRAFSPDETRAGAPGPVAILGHGFWTRRFGADPAVVGRVIRIDDEPMAVIGVMPATEGWMQADVYLPLQPVVTVSQSRRILRVTARLREGVSIEKANQALAIVAEGIGEEWPELHRGWTARAIPFRDFVVGPDTRRLLAVLAGAVLLVLLMACANLASLLLARAVGRRREIAIHAALGAGRIRLVRRVLTEALMLAALGAGGGVLIALWAVDAFRRFGAGRIPRLDGTVVDGTVLAFAAGLAIVTGLVAGLIPAIQSSRAPVGEALKEAGGSGTAGATRQRLRTVLVIGQVALAASLLTGAALLMRSLARAATVDPGLETANRYAITVNLPPTSYEMDDRVVSFWRTVLEGVREVPGVVAASATSDRWLLAGRRIVQYEVEGDAEMNRRVPVAELRTVTPGYFETLGIPVLEGRTFADSDAGTVQTPGEKRMPFVVLVSRTLAARQWPGESAVGKRIRPRVGDNEAFWSIVIGVVDDIRQSAVTESPVPAVYLPEYQYAWLRLFLLVHAEPDPAATFAPVRAAIAAVDPTVPTDDLLPLPELLADSLAVERSTTIVLTVFAVVAVLLAAVGVYGLLAYAVTCRTQEFGMRMALGATRGDLLRLIVGEGFRLALRGVVIGIPIAFVLAGSLRAMLFEVSPNDPLTYAAVAGLLLVVAVAACLAPGWRATHVDPAAALRAE